MKFVAKGVLERIVTQTPDAGVSSVVFCFCWCCFCFVVFLLLFLLCSISYNGIVGAYYQKTTGSLLSFFPKRLVFVFKKPFFLIPLILVYRVGLFIERIEIDAVGVLLTLSVIGLVLALLIYLPRICFWRLLLLKFG